jgi:Methyltransferase domain
MRDDGHFHERVAAVYDDYENDPTRTEFAAEDVENTVRFLAQLAGDGHALEFGVGTGRIALPLSQRDVPTYGIDISRPMVERLRAKPGGEDIPVSIGDFATTSVEGSFSLVYLICNTIMNLTTQEAQVACFRNAAAHLRAGGRFVIKVMVPELQRLPPGETLHVFAAGDKHWGIDEYDIANQGLVSHHFEERDGRLERSSMPFRYVWPSELDVMAELAGMRLRERWGAGIASRSRARAASTSPCGKRRVAGSSDLLQLRPIEGHVPIIGLGHRRVGHGFG